MPQGATGLVEVNHPGGGCWAGTTPYLSPGDIVRTIAKDAAGITTAIDQTTVANVTAERPVQTAPGTVVVHGTAKGANGGQIPVDQIEQRLVSSSANPFALNGRRTLRAASVRPSTARCSTTAPRRPAGRRRTRASARPTSTSR